jgi:hypothetical protein
MRTEPIDGESLDSWLERFAAAARYRTLTVAAEHSWSLSARRQIDCFVLRGGVPGAASMDNSSYPRLYAAKAHCSFGWSLASIFRESV